MVATAKCPHCKKRLRNETPGQAVQCPGCNQPFRMPSILGEADDPLQPDAPVAEWDDVPQQTQSEPEPEPEPQPETENQVLLRHVVECKELLDRIDATESRVAVSAADAASWMRYLSKQITLLNRLVLIIAIPFIVSLGLFFLMLALGFVGALFSGAK